MALGNAPALVNNAVKNLITANDISGNIAFAHSLIDQNGVAIVVAQDGVDAAGVTVPTGGVGIRGWLSGIYSRLTSTLTIQGVAGGTPIPVTGSFSASTSGQYNTTLPTYTSGQATTLQTDANGRLFIGNFPTSQAVTGTFFPATQPVSIATLPALAAGSAAIGSVTVSNTVAIIAASPIPVTSTTSAITTVVSTAVESGHIFKASPGTLYFVNVQVSAAGYFMLFNSPSVPGDGTVTPANAPVYFSQAGTYTVDYGASGKAFSSGISAAYSSTGPLTKTASATAFFEWNVA